MPMRRKEMYMRRVLSEISYRDICLILFLFNVLDMLSTDIIIFHGKGMAVESNYFISYLHEKNELLLFRVIFLFIMWTFLLSCRINDDELHLIRKESSIKLLVRKSIGQTAVSNIKIQLFICCSIISVTRFFVALSRVRTH